MVASVDGYLGRSLLRVVALRRLVASRPLLVSPLSADFLHEAMDVGGGHVTAVPEVILHHGVVAAMALERYVHWDDPSHSASCTSTNGM